MTPEEAELWRAFKDQGSARARERLFALHQAFARTIAAGRFKARGKTSVEFADLCQLAYTGLLEALDLFDPHNGAPFKAYALRRIHGAILDGIARMTEVRQQISHRTRMRAERARSLAAEGVDNLTALEALDALTQMAVGLALGFMMEGAGLYVPGDIQDDAPDAYESLAWKEAVQRLAAAAARLPEQERAILKWHYTEGLTFDQIGALVGVSKSRISQIHRRALASLKATLAEPVDFHLVR